MAHIYNPTVDQGAVWTIEIEYLDSNDNPIDLTGFSAAMQLRENYDSSTAVLTLTTQNGAIVIDGPNGTVTVTMTSQQTKDLDATWYLYDVELYSGANVIRLIQGQISIAGEVTRV